MTALTTSARTPTGIPILEVRHVSKVYTSGVFIKDITRAADDVSLAIYDDPPVITAVAGESGSGKTTLSLLMMGQLAPTAGQVLYRGKDIRRMSRAERKQMRREVQPIFQDPFSAYNPFYRVDHVLEMAMSHFGLAHSKAEASTLIGEALELVGLRPAETLGRFPHQLSGGQRQRLMVARALLCRPKLIMADEPVSMVDASLRATILASLRRLNRELGIAVVYITHDLTTAYQVAENIAVMYAGSIVESGTVDQVIRDPKHPYTQLLIASIPLPDKRTAWGENANESPSSTTRKSTGCRFAPRCPVVMDRCWTDKPQLSVLDKRQAAACYLYDA